MTPTDTMLSTPEVCRVTGLSYRQIDSWTRLGVFRPVVSARGSGTQRRFSLDQAIGLRACHVLCRLGAPTRIFAKVMRTVPAMVVLDDPLLAGRVIIDNDGEVSTIADGDEGWVIDLAACIEWVNGYLAIG